ncbi:MAG: glycosyltransferase family A protein [Patescibacteria group bacterium]
MQEIPRISVIIPCFNHADILRRTLEGLSSQTLKPLEVIVVNDGSSDDPSVAVREAAQKLPITFISLKSNKGAPYARNLGATTAGGDFFMFLDADAILQPTALQLLHGALSQNPDAVFSYSNFFWGAKRFKAKPFDVAALKNNNFIHTSSMIRRCAFPGFDEKLARFQDWDLWLTIAKRGGVGVWIDKELFRVEPRSAGISRWLPRVMYWIPWQWLGFIPKEISKYRDAEAIVRKKHGI